MSAGIANPQATVLAAQYGVLVPTYGQLTPAQAELLGAQLGGFGASASQVQSGVNAINGMLPAAVTTINALKSGNVTGAIQDATPLICAGLAATGVGTVAVAAVAGGLEAFTLIADALGLFQPKPQQTCLWVVGNVCFNLATGRPYGPADPDWLTIDAYTSAANANGQPGWAYVKSPGDHPEFWGNAAFQWWGDVGRELYALGDRSIAAQNWATYETMDGNNPDEVAALYVPGSTPAMVSQWATLGQGGQDFCRTFDLAWIKMAEMFLNGATAPDPSAFISSFITAWNVAHPVATSTLAFDGTGVTFIDQVIAGNAGTPIGGETLVPQRLAPTIPINIPPHVYVGVPVVHGSGWAGSGQVVRFTPSGPKTSMSTAKKAALVVGGTVAAAAGGAAIYGYATDQGIGYLFGLAADAITGVLFAGELAAEEAVKGKTHVQSLLFPRSRFTPSKAKRWAISHGYRASKTDVTENYVRIRQRPPSDFSTFRTVPLGSSGVKAVVGR